MFRVSGLASVATTYPVQDFFPAAQCSSMKLPAYLIACEHCVLQAVVCLRGAGRGAPASAQFCTLTKGDDCAFASGWQGLTQGNGLEASTTHKLQRQGFGSACELYVCELPLRTPLQCGLSREQAIAGPDVKLNGCRRVPGLGSLAKEPDHRQTVTGRDAGSGSDIATALNRVFLL